MAKKFDSLLEEHIDFISNQKIFFVATALDTGRVNLSPKGMDSFRVLDGNTVAWLNVTGSGNETATHVQIDPRMTIMFCAFEGKPLILRLYGAAEVFHPRDQIYQELKSLFPDIPGARQIFQVKVDLVQTSCGYAVPFMDFKEERTQLKTWAEKQGEERIHAYWEEKNTVSLDGLSSNILQ